MTVGIELYRDGDTDPYFSDKTGFILGAVSFSFGSGGGSASHVDNNLLNGTPFYFIATTAIGRQVDVSFTGNQMDYSTDEAWTGRLFYGIR